ncbi:hypothetical protein GLW20_05845 [Virgibacillus halodenitrificans]|nr:hypothetical protein [Virgibacillus halodenitrificans]
MNKIELYKKKTGQYPAVIFAVSVGEYVIPLVTERIGKEHVVHIDEKGKRFC